MANNRLYIRCKQCGETFYLAKHFGGSLNTTDYDGDFLDRLNDFWEKHCYCQSDKGHYCLELCEEFPGEMTDSVIDAFGNVDWPKECMEVRNGI